MVRYSLYASPMGVKTLLFVFPQVEGDVDWILTLLDYCISTYPALHCGFVTANHSFSRGARASFRRGS